MAASITPTEKSINSPNNIQNIDLEQNITPIEEHFDVTFANNSNVNNTPTDSNTSSISTARDITKRIESFSKGIMETLKFDKRSTNPFDFEIEIGATEIHPKDLLKDSDIIKSDQLSKINGNSGDNRNYLNDFGMMKSSGEGSIDKHDSKILDIFEHKTASMFHTLLPLIFGHIAALAHSDPRSSVHVLSLIREILPHVAALNKINASKDRQFDMLSSPIDANLNETVDELDHNLSNLLKDQEGEANNVVAATAMANKSNTSDLITTSNHYCIIESEHPYKAASITNYK